MTRTFYTIPQSNQARPHVEIRAPEMQVQALPLAPAPNAFAKGASSLQQALADRKLKEDEAARAADPWNGMRETQAPLAGLREGLGKLFGPRV